MNFSNYRTIGLVALLGLISFAPLSATPTLALKEAQNCQGCHSPGRSQLPVLERRCTLDCQGCHIDPSGAGARNAWGKYYSYMEMNAWNPILVQDPLKDESRFDLHFDGRYMKLDQVNGEKQFPMGAETTLRVRPFIEYLHFVYNLQALGRTNSDSLSEDSDNHRRFRQRYMVMVDKIPMNLYLKAFRGQPNYGLRRPNHALWIRERLGLDQFALTDGLEFGGTPNVPFFRYTLMEGNPEQEEEDRQKGYSAHGGFRGVTLGWHVNSSLWKTKSEKVTIDMSAVGMGANLFDFIVYGERNWREVKRLTSYMRTNGANAPLTVHPSSVISEYKVTYSGLHGVLFNYFVEDMTNDDKSFLRRSVSLNLHLIPGLQLEVWRRKNETLDLMDTMMIAHLYFDW